MRKTIETHLAIRDPWAHGVRVGHQAAAEMDPMRLSSLMRELAQHFQNEARRLRAEAADAVASAGVCREWSRALLLEARG